MNKALNQALLRNKAGVSFALAGKLPQAIQEFDLAAQLAPSLIDPQVNAARAARELGRFEEAATRLTNILYKWPRHGGARLELAYLCSLQGDLQGEILNYRLALDALPEDSKAHWNLALALLSNGQLKAGFAEFEWRFRCPEYAPFAFKSEAITRWRGEPLEGRNLLVVTEQGLGDAIQFVRYAHLLKDMGASVTVRCWPRMQRLLSSCEGVDETMAESDHLPKCDYWISMLSLPHQLGTDANSIPAYESYLQADVGLVKFWKERLHRKRVKDPVRNAPGLLVGLSWQGSQENPRDAQRSLPLAAMKPLCSLPGIRWISLQRDVSPADQRSLSELSVVDLGSQLDRDAHAFWDTAAVIENLDLVIGCDSAVGHLAGALGIPTWLALARYPDWRWQRSGDRTPWYLRTKLYRQTKAAHWQDVIQQMSNDLVRLASSNSMPSSTRTGKLDGRLK